MDKMGVPTVLDYIKNPADRELVENFMAQTVFGRPYVMTPGAPADRVKIIRQSFNATTKDKAFLAEAKKVRLSIDPAAARKSKGWSPKCTACQPPNWPKSSRSSI